MNPKFKLTLLGGSSEKGFAFPLALLAGLVMVMAGLTMVTRSQSDQSKVFAQQAKADGLTVAEVAVTEIQNSINSNRHLSTANSHCDEGETECWANLTTTPTSGSWADPENPALMQLQRDFVQDLINEKLAPEDKCPVFEESEKKALESKIAKIKSEIVNDSNRIDEILNVTQSPDDLKSDKSSTWKSLDKKVNKEGVDPYRYYRMVRYEYNTFKQQGTLVVDGLYRNDQLASSKVDNSESRSRLAVTFPIQLPALDPVLAGPLAPGLWIREGATNDGSKSIGSDGSYAGNTHFRANVAMSDVCSFSKDQQKNISNFITDTHINPYEDKKIPEDYNAGFVAQDIPLLPEMLDGLEDISAASSSSTNNIYNQLLDSQKNITINKNSFSGGSSKGDDKDESKDSLVFPKDPDNDKTIAVKLNNGKTANYYVYIIDSIDLSGNKQIIIPFGQKVMFLVKGNITIKGNSGIAHDCSKKPDGTPSDVTCEATDFLVLGYADPAKTTSPEICLKGNAQMDAFIYAPEYHIGITGNDKNETKYKGSIWARDWGKISDCGSVGNHVAIRQGAKYDLLPEGMIPHPEGLFINSIASWRQCSFDEVIESCVDPNASPSPSPSP